MSLSFALTKGLKSSLILSSIFFWVTEAWAKARFIFNYMLWGNFFPTLMCFPDPVSGEILEAGFCACLVMVMATHWASLWVSVCRRILSHGYFMLESLSCWTGFCRGAVWRVWFTADDDLREGMYFYRFTRTVCSTHSVWFRLFLAGGIRVLFIFLKETDCQF